MTKQELNELSHSIAYESSVSLIEECSVDVTREACGWPSDKLLDEPGVWWKLNLEPDKRMFWVNALADAVRYLEARGLLTRHPSNPNWVSIADEREATPLDA